MDQEQDQKNIFAKNLNHYLDITDQSQREVATAIDVSPQTFNTWCQAIAIPRMDKIQKLADYFQINKSDLIDRHSYNPSPQVGVRIPVAGHVAAGIPIDAVEDIIDYEEIPESMARTGDYIGLQIKGDSMEPDIHDGDYVIVRKQPDAESGEIVIALINGDDGVCKKLKKMEDGGIMLISLNSRYEPMIYRPEEIDEIPVSIFGKVVELRRRF